MSPSKTLHKLFLLSSICGALPLTALAQDGTGSQPGMRQIEEILITARRREEDVQSVPVSVAAFSDMRLTEANVQTLNDLTSLVPGLRFSAEGGKNNSNVTLRGLGKLPIGDGIPAVVNYFAEAPMPSDGANIPTYDLANIQVLKGPQGTLFGRNTIGGAVLITPAAPGYQHEGYIKGTLGNYDNRVIEGAVNVPVVDDRLAIRLAGQWWERDGVTENLNAGPDFDDIDQQSARLSILFDPSDSVSNTLILDYFKAHEQPNGPAIIGAQPEMLGPYLNGLIGGQIHAYHQAQRRAGYHKAYSTLPGGGYANRESKGVVNTTSWDITDDITLKNIVSFREIKQSILINTGGVGPITVPANPVAETPPGELIIYHASSDKERRFITEELQLQGQSLDGKLEWILGGFFSVDKDIGPTGSQFQRFDFLGDGPDLNYSASYIENRSKALFVQASYDLSELTVDGLKLNLGYRHTWDDVKACGGGGRSDRYMRLSECETISALNQPDGTGVIKNSGDAGTYTIGFDWTVTDNVFLYATHRRGYRGVSVNTPLFETPYTTGGGGCVLGGAPVTCLDLRPFQTSDEETIEDFELGIKSDWMLGGTAARLNIALFNMEYQDGLQFVNVVDAGGIPGTAPDAPGRGSIAVNAADITVRGAEVDVSISPTDNLSFSATGAYIDQSVDKVNVPAIGPNVALSKAEVNLPTPRFSGTLGVRWQLPVRPLGGDLVWNLDHFYTSEWSAQSAVELPSYHVTNTRLDWNNINGGGVSVGAWMRNLTDEEYASAPVVLVPLFPTSTIMPGEPRTFGVDIRYSWGS